MPIIIDWYDKQHNIFLHKYLGDWTNNESDIAEAEIRQLCDMVTERFDFIADLTQANFTLPVGSLYIWISSAIERDKDYPNWGLTVFVTSNPLHHAYFESGYNDYDVIRKHCRLVGTIAEGVRVIMADRLEKRKSLQANR